MSVRSAALLAVVVATGAALALPAGAAGLAFGPDTGHRASSLAPGPGGDLWAMGDRLELRRPDGSARLAVDVGVDAYWTRLAAGPDGSAWVDVAGKPQLQRISPAGRRTVYDLPYNPTSRWDDGLDVAPSGTVWTTASSLEPNGDPDGFVRVIRRPLRGRTAVSASLPSPGMATVAATGDRDAWMAARCGIVHLRLAGDRLRVVGPQPRCASRADRARTPMALRRASDGSLWRVLENGHVVRGVGDRARTVARLGPMESKLDRWDAGPISIAFTGRRPVVAWVQTEITVVEVGPRGATVHAVPPRTDPETDLRLPLDLLVADGRGRLWGVFEDTVTRIRPRRCAVPRVVGLTSRAAARTLRSRGCAPVLRTPRGLRPGHGLVVRQSVAAGRTVRTGARVVLSERRYEPRCHVDPRRRTVVRRSVRWTITRDVGPDFSAIYACDRRTGRDWVVVDPEGEDEGDTTSLSVAGFAGDWLLLTYARESPLSHSGGEENTSLQLADLAKRRRTTITSYGSSWWSDGMGNGDSSSGGTAFVSPALNSRGDVAWLEPHAVVLRRRGKDRTVLATDPAATYAGLRFDGARLRWTADGVAQSAPVR